MMTTAELLEAKLYYAGIKQLLDAGLIERIKRWRYQWIEDCEESGVVMIPYLTTYFLMPFFAWKWHCSIMGTVTEIGFSYIGKSE